MCLQKEKQMKKLIGIVTVGALALGAGVAEAADRGPARQAMRYVDGTKVIVDDAFWGPKLALWRTNTVFDVFDKFERQSHALGNFDKAAKGERGGHCGAHFFDGLVYESLRGACDYLAREPSDDLAKLIDSAVDRIVAAQRADGYLHTWVQLGHAEKQWGDNGGSPLEQHEIYDAGCLVEAGVHHYRATGKTKLLAAAIRFANCLCDTIGPRPKRNLIPSHSIAEEALVKLARLLKDEPDLAAKAGVKARPDDYLKLVKFWFDAHGDNCGQPDWPKFIAGSDNAGVIAAMRELTKTKHDAGWRISYWDYQMDAKSLKEYRAIEGHAVRAALLVLGLAAYGRETGDAESLALARRFWSSMTGQKMYVSGGVGAKADLERFADDYELPPDAYLETCAAVASAFTSGCLAEVECDGKYMDEFERVIYNALLTAVGTNGCTYTYQNPLNTAKGSRWAWHGCPCCPPMFLKLTGALPGYVYGTDAKGVRVNLFMGSRTEVVRDGVRVAVAQRTKYPDEGRVEIAVDPERPVRFRLAVRIPGWARGVESHSGLYVADRRGDWSLNFNGHTVAAQLENGYAVVDREWRKGDVLTVNVDVSPRTVRADARVKQVRGLHAVLCGPVVMAEERGKTIPYWRVANEGEAPHKVWLEDSKTVTELTVDVDPAADAKPIAPTMYGIFYEDVNGTADGGLYAELILNRSFEFEQPFTGWIPFGAVELRKDGPFKRCPNYVRLSKSAERFQTGLSNAGFPGGMRLERGKAYRVSLWARAADAKGKLSYRFDSRVRVPGAALAAGTFAVDGAEWTRYSTVVTAAETADRAEFRLILDGDSPVDVEHVSVMPVDTWKGRENGLRKDLVQALADLKPGLFRFPGGCIVEGRTLAGRYDWKNSVGPVENRPTLRNFWSATVRDRLNPEYHMSYGLGFFELFQLAEDVGAEPLPIVNCGLHCQFAAWDQHGKDDLGYLDAYVQDALDLVEFACGDAATPWGRVRAEMGHPQPFRLNYLGVGNEQWDEPDDAIYTVRLRRFEQALHAKWPKLRIVACGGNDLGGEQCRRMRKILADVPGVYSTDEHKYGDAGWFAKSGTVYDGTPRGGQKVFVTEFAEVEPDGWGRFNRAMSGVWEAAFLTTLERNCDLVEAAMYAPDFVNRNAWNWAPGLIWFDTKGWTATSSYKTQKLFAEFRGVKEIPALADGKPLAGADGVFASAVLAADGRPMVRLVNVNRTAVKVSLRVKGDGREAKWKGFAASASDVEKTVPLSGKAVAANGAFALELPPRSVICFGVMR